MHQTIAKVVEYHHVTATSRHVIITTTLYLKWKPPDRGFHKLNTDGAACLNTGKGGYWGVFRNNRGDWVLGFMGGLTNTDSLRAELQALWMGRKIALDQGLSPIVIDTDSEVMLKMLKHGNLTHNPIISECRYVIEQLVNLVIGHSYREQNQVADLLAKEGAKKEVFTKTQFLAVPRCLQMMQCRQTS
nr:uncharacterized protein LOC104111114 [Nicotiana tomentosiformis]